MVDMNVIRGDYYFRCGGGGMVPIDSSMLVYIIVAEYCGLRMRLYFSPFLHIQNRFGLDWIPVGLTPIE